MQLENLWVGVHRYCDAARDRLGLPKPHDHLLVAGDETQGSGRNVRGGNVGEMKLGDTIGRVTCDREHPAVRGCVASFRMPASCTDLDARNPHAIGTEDFGEPPHPFASI